MGFNSGFKVLMHGHGLFKIELSLSLSLHRIYYFRFQVSHIARFCVNVTGQYFQI